MFKEARIKLSGWYLLIIMVISLSFSGAIYAGVNNELIRMDNAQKERQAKVDLLRSYLKQNSFQLPPEQSQYESETIEIARVRILSGLGFINLAILVLSGVGGYILAGITLEPISKMVEEQKEFVSNASHELRTPLTSLKTQIEVALRDKKLTFNDARDLLKSSLDDVNSMQKLSNYLLKLNKYDLSAKLDIAKIDLGRIVLNVIDDYVQGAANKKIKINKNIEQSFINGNEESIGELAAILIDNAIKYSGKSHRIDISVTKTGTFSVKDYGLGIAENDIPHIFDRFYRADASRCKEKIEGYGLGLSIAKSIADKAGAKIKVTSSLGKGSTFLVQFPVAA